MIVANPYEEVRLESHPKVAADAAPANMMAARVS